VDADAVEAERGDRLKVPEIVGRVGEIREEPAHDNHVMAAGPIDDGPETIGLEDVLGRVGPSGLDVERLDAGGGHPVDVVGADGAAAGAGAGSGVGAGAGVAKSPTGTAAPAGPPVAMRSAGSAPDPPTTRRRSNAAPATVISR